MNACQWSVYHIVAFTETNFMLYISPTDHLDNLIHHISTVRQWYSRGCRCTFFTNMMIKIENHIILTSFRDRRNYCCRFCKL